MKTTVTTVTNRGQISIPGGIRRSLGLTAGSRLCWERVTDTECRVFVQTQRERVGAKTMMGYARSFRPLRRTQDWMAELREGDAR